MFLLIFYSKYLLIFYNKCSINVIYNKNFINIQSTFSLFPTLDFPFQNKILANTKIFLSV